MSEETKAILRAVLYQVRIAKSLEEATAAIEIIAGPQNMAEVDGMIKAQKDKK